MSSDLPVAEVRALPKRPNRGAAVAAPGLFTPTLGPPSVRYTKNHTQQTEQCLNTKTCFININITAVHKINSLLNKCSPGYQFNAFCKCSRVMDQQKYQCQVIR